MALNEPLISHHFPYLPISVTFTQMTYQLEALLDTGFDGYVVLPPERVAGGDAPDWYLTCRLADGSEVLAPAYRGTVRLGTSESTPAVVMVLGDEPLIGRGVIEHFRIVLDHGQRLVVEP